MLFPVLKTGDHAAILEHAFRVNPERHDSTDVYQDMFKYRILISQDRPTDPDAMVE